jgi:hypothetical protein
MKFEMTRCNQCGSEMLMGATLCPSCGQGQTGYGKRGGLYQRGVMLAVALSALVLLVFNYINSPAPRPNQLTPPSAVTLPSR